MIEQLVYVKVYVYVHFLFIFISLTIKAKTNSVQFSSTSMKTIFLPLRKLSPINSGKKIQEPQVP